jgi:hypothetical protein
MVWSQLRWLPSVRALGEAIFLQSPEELLYIVFSKVPANAEFSNDLINDFWLRRAVFQKFEDSRSDEVEVEHLALPDIQDNGAILAVRASNTF